MCITYYIHEKGRSEVQWNPFITATVGEWHFGRYREVAVVEGFRVLGVLVHVIFKKNINCGVCKM